MLVVTHRGPYAFRPRDDTGFDARRGAGGVVSALGPLLLDPEGPPTVWIAAAISEQDRAAAAAGAAEAVSGVDLRLLVLDPREHRLHYDVVSNAVLWFLHHGLFDLVRRPSFDERFREAWEAYASVNRHFALTAAEAAAEGDVVLVQDYQLALVPGYLRAARPDLRVVHFTHTPFCGPNSIRVLPIDVARQLCSSLAGGAAGFHVPRWARAYEASARDVLGAGAAIRPPFSASLGPDATSLAETAADPATVRAATELGDVVGDRQVVLRADRVEPSKNIVRGFLAYERLLAARPDLRERVVFVAMLYRSRDSLPEYLAYGNEVEQAVHRVNDRFGTAGWDPVVLDVRDDYHRSVAGLQRYDVLLVNPLKDGLNLVAKEGPLLNGRDGTLCLSRDAGAFDELHPAALEIHPYDLDQAAAALAAALDAAPEERAERATRLRELAAARSPAIWLADLVAQA